jgi:hypothetical protein
MTSLEMRPPYRLPARPHLIFIDSDDATPPISPRASPPERPTLPTTFDLIQLQLPIECLSNVTKFNTICERGLAATEETEHTLNDTYGHFFNRYPDEGFALTLIGAMVRDRLLIARMGRLHVATRCLRTKRRLTADRAFIATVWPHLESERRMAYFRDYPNQSSVWAVAARETCPAAHREYLHVVFQLRESPVLSWLSVVYPCVHCDGIPEQETN